MEELIKNALLEATWWEHKLSKRQKTKISMNEARKEIIDDISKSLLKQIKNIKSN